MARISIFFTALYALAVSPVFAKQHSTSIEKAVENASVSECFFLPPKNWEIADPRSLSPRVKIAFIKNTGKGLCPSINLAVEQTQVSLSDYLKAVKAIHEQDRNNRWRALGKVRTAAGLAQLTEIDSSSEWGSVRLLQLILLKSGTAYVLTAAALKEEFSDFYKEFQSAFRSLTLSTDLLSNVPQLERRETLRAKQKQLIEGALSSAKDTKTLLNDPLFQKEQWLPFQDTIISNFSDMGAFWQILLLKDTQEKMLASLLPDPPVEGQTENK